MDATRLNNGVKAVQVPALGDRQVLRLGLDGDEAAVLRSFLADRGPAIGGAADAVPAGLVEGGCLAAPFGGKLALSLV